MVSPVTLVFCFVLIYEIHEAPAKETVPSGRDSHSANQLLYDKRKDVVTLVFKAEQSIDSSLDYRPLMRQSIASSLNRRMLIQRQEKAVHRPNIVINRLEEEEEPLEFSEYDVIVLDAVPIDARRIAVSLIVQQEGESPESDRFVYESVDKERLSISSYVGLHLESVYMSQLAGEEEEEEKGEHDVPRFEAQSSVTQTTAPDNRQKTIWEAHQWLFIAVLIFIGISAVLIILCCICIRCRRKSPTLSEKKEEIKEEPPTHVITSSGPMQEQTPPNEPPPLDEENGWIIPLDQMTKEELEQPEVQMSRL